MNAALFPRLPNHAALSPEHQAFRLARQEMNQRFVAWLRAEPTADFDSEIGPIRGGRRRDGLAIMWRKNQLTDAQMAAAERYRTELATAAGARVSLPGDVVRTRLRGRNFEPTVAQVDAITSCKAAWKSVGPIHQPVLSWVVVSWGTLEGYAECKHMRRERASKMLVEALDRLADFYTAGHPGHRPA